MPFYDLVCSNCKREEEVRGSYEYVKGLVCEHCKSAMEIKIGLVNTSWGCECPTSSGGKSTDLSTSTKREGEILYNMKGSPVNQMQDISCDACQIKYEVFLPADAVIRDTCPTCGVLMTRCVTVPSAIRDSTSASDVDGFKKEGLANIREANKLKIMGRDLRPEQRMQVKKEVAKLLRVR